MRRYCARVILAAATFATPILGIGCGGDSEPAGITRPTDSARLFGECAPVNDGLRCTARQVGLSGPADVTNAASWTAVPSAAVRFSSPGAVVPLERADVRIVASFQGLQNSNGLTFRIAPGVPARELTSFGVTVTDATGAAVAAALVEVVAGTGSGMSCRTTANGLCAVSPVEIGESLTVRVAADGFVPVERTVQVVTPSSTSLVIVQLARVQ